MVAISKKKRPKPGRKEGAQTEDTKTKVVEARGDGPRHTKRCRRVKSRPKDLPEKKWEEQTQGEGETPKKGRCGGKRNKKKKSPVSNSNWHLQLGCAAAKIWGEGKHGDSGRGKRLRKKK